VGVALRPDKGHLPEVDRMAVIFPFEVPLYREVGL
jgi:hypothetical protein